MSLTGLLKKHGVKSPRIVSAIGGVAIGGSSLGYQIPAHTFHGGTEAEDVAGSGSWWESREIRELDRLEMSEHFPGFNEIGDLAEPPVWTGEIDTGRGKFTILVIHRKDHGLPRVVPLRKDLGRNRRGLHVDPPHVYLNGNLCVAAESDWDPQRHDTATVVAWACHWFACYIDWFVGLPWPSEGIAVEAA